MILRWHLGKVRCFDWKLLIKEVSSFLSLKSCEVGKKMLLSESQSESLDLAV